VVTRATVLSTERDVRRIAHVIDCLTSTAIYCRVARASRRYARRVASNAARWIHEIASKTPRRTAETNRDVAFVAVNDELRRNFANAKF